MQTKWLLIGIAILTAVLAIGAIACSDDNDDELEDILDEIQDELDEIGIFRLTASLSGPEASGEADISINGDGILVALTMEGLTEGSHANHLHHGDCFSDPPGEVHITLDGIVADENGDGTQTTANDEQPLDHFVADHYLAVHGDDGAIVSCGDVVDPLA